jgi:NADH-quinone oxidoreductase subunit E
MSINSAPDFEVVAFMERINEDLTAMVPREMQGLASLMAHPMAGAVAMSAVGFGMASHAAGLWLGTMSGMATASQKAMDALVEGMPRQPAAVREAMSAPVQQFAEVVQELQEVAESAAAPHEEVLPPTEADMPAPRTAGGDTSDAESAAKTVIADAPTLLPEDFVRPVGMAKPDVPDDLKLISGIGPKLEQVLNGMGVWTFAQVAAWGPAEIAWVDDSLGFKGRIGRDDWIGQAAGLVAKA